MSVPAEPQEVDGVPSEVRETARMAMELHSQLFPTEKQEETPPAEGDGLPAGEPPNDPEPPKQATSDVDPEEETFQKRYDSLKGKYNKVTSEIAELRQLVENLKSGSTPQPKEPDPVEQKVSERQAKINEVMEALSKEYPDELIENLRLLQRLEAEEVAEQKLKPLSEKAQSVEDIQTSAAQQQYVDYISEKAPNWQEVWTTAQEIRQGIIPKNDAVAEFLLAPDPSGLYTNLELAETFVANWDADRFITLCNLVEPAPKQPEPPPAKRQQQAMVAPSRSNSQPAAPKSDEPKVWTMKEVNEFTAQSRNGKYTEEQKSAIWADIQKALAENRITG